MCCHTLPQPQFIARGPPVTDLTTLTRRSFMLTPLALAACNSGQSFFDLTGLTMGTTYRVVAVNTPASIGESDLRNAIDGALAQVNVQMSNWDSQSEISKINAYAGAEVIPVSAELDVVMQAAAQVNSQSHGAFDTTMGPLIDLWGFGAAGEQPMPSTDQITTAQALSGHHNTLNVAPGTVQKTNPDAQIYLAAIGKGYGADHVGRALESLGVADYMVEIGGDLYASGRNPDGLPWQIGIETPNAHDRGVMDVVGLSGLGLASSGDYRNYFEVDGERYSHVIDPTTGRPITHRTASATVLAENGMLADAWATAMLILGRDRGLEIAAEQDIAVMFVERDPNATQMQFIQHRSAAFDRLTA